MLAPRGSYGATLSNGMGLNSATEITWTRDTVGVGIYHGTLGTHIGIVFHNGQSTQIVHLAWHLKLCEESFPKPNWLAAVIDLPATVTPQVVSLLRKLCKRYPITQDRPDGVTYGLNLVAGRGAFRATGAYKPGKDCDGFTCASFVAEVFRHFGLELVRLDTMLGSPRNHAWAEAIICMLTAYKATPEHIDKVRRSVNGTRLRPEDVCAAIEVPAAYRPVDQEAIMVRADEIHQEVIDRCGPPPPINHVVIHCKADYEAALARISQDEASSAAPPM